VKKEKGMRRRRLGGYKGKRRKAEKEKRVSCDIVVGHVCEKPKGVKRMRERGRGEQ